MKHLNKIILSLLAIVFLALIFSGCESQYMTAGKVYLQQKPPNYDAAITQFKKAVEAEPNNADTYIWLGKAYAGKKSFEEACKWTEKGLSHNPKKLDELKRDMTFNYWAVFYNAGLRFLKNKEFEHAIKRLSRSLDFDNKNTLSMNMLAYCYIKLKRDSDAENTYKKAIKLVPDDINTYINLANFYKIHSKSDDTETTLKKAQKIIENPDWLKIKDQEVIKKRKKASAEVYIELGSVLLNKKKFDEAEKILAKAISLSPDDKDVNFNYGLALLEMKKYDNAIKIFQKVTKLDSLDEEGYFNLGFSYLKAKKYTEAIQAFSKAIELKPDYCEAYLDRAFAERELGNTSAAYKDAKLGTNCQKSQKK